MSRTPPPCPLVFAPRLLPKLWGGRRLARWGRTLPGTGAFGESWEIFDDAQGSPECVQGPAVGCTLAALARAWGRDLYGSVAPGPAGRFPLLFKLLDAREDLSIQVHPSDALARRLHGPEAVGKQELWVVLEAEAGARVLNGFKDGATWPRVRDALAKGRPDELLRTVPVRAGDVIDVPAGRPHALGAGCLVAEVQQNSDWTYRLWDYGRLEQGRPRPLHLHEAEQALRFDAVGLADGRVASVGAPQAWGLREGLVANEHFTVERWTLKPGATSGLEGRLRVLMPLDGDLELAWEGGALPLNLGRGQVALAPAVLSGGLRAGPHGAVVLCAEPR